MTRRQRTRDGFTMLETIIAIGLIGVGVASSIGALTKVNSIASMSRNATGASTVVMNEIDAILSNGPFNPQKTNKDGTKQIPPELQLTPAGQPRTKTVAIYKEPTSGVIVGGTMSTTVSDASATYNGRSLIMYRATVTVKYTYLNRNYSFSMSTLRASDL